MKSKAVFSSLRGVSVIEKVYSSRTRGELEMKLDFLPPLYSMDALAARAAEWKDVEFLFTSWGCPELTKEQISGYFPRLKAVFYAAGSVQYFARPFLELGIRVFTANEALSIPVVEFTVAQIFLANKGYFQAVRLYREASPEDAKKYFSNFPGNEGIAVGILGAGRIGKGVIEKLRNTRVKVNVFDPFLSAGDAENLGVCKIENLEELFSRSFVISNHLANNEQTKGMIQYRHFSLMHDYGVFINTGRGAQVNEDGLVRALKEKPGRTALLDVTFPEPAEKGHPFYTMNNVLISPHVAGASGNEQIWLGEYIAQEFTYFTAHEPLRSEVTFDMLLTMA